MSEQQTASETEVQRYFREKSEIQIAIKVLENISGKGHFDNEVNPAIYKLKGMLLGMRLAECAFDL